MEQRLRKIAGTEGSEGINSCPTVLELGDDVILQGYDLDAATRRELAIPNGENAVRMSKELYLRGARTLTEGG